MKRRSRWAVWVAAWILLMGTTLMPRMGAGYQVPIEEPPRKGDPDEPGGRQLPPSVSRFDTPPRGSILVIRFQLLPGLYFQTTVRVPNLLGRRQDWSSGR